MQSIGVVCFARSGGCRIPSCGRFPKSCAAWAIYDCRLPYCTTMAGAQAAVEGIRALKTQRFEVKALQDYHPR
ncbi:MAG TPA: hypothetical protein VKV03_14650 [Candidatus Binataceae bacterium]|nr:hypothetical protein [Candidatus Binataceae bacterium]